MAFPRVRIGVSACLLGQAVRYDGGHQRDGFITGPLAGFVDYVPVCPEVGAGLGVPRLPIHLVGDLHRPRAVSSGGDGADVTEALETFARDQAEHLSGISGYVLKSASPSCGVQGVKVYGAQSDSVLGEGPGIYARVMMDHQPALPVEEERRLNDPVPRESFLTRVFVYHRWLALEKRGVDARRLTLFHREHRYLILSRTEKALATLGRKLPNVTTGPRGAERAYIRDVMQFLNRPARRGDHAAVLQRILKELAVRLDAEEASTAVRSVESYRRGEVPWLVPARLLRHYVDRCPECEMAFRRYLEPFPDELSLTHGG